MDKNISCFVCEKKIDEIINDNGLPPSPRCIFICAECAESKKRCDRLEEFNHESRSW